MRFAFAAAEKRPKKLLTVVTKSNSLRNGMVLWDEVALVSYFCLVLFISAMRLNADSNRKSRRSSR
jgi:hypothetical protein